MGGELDGDEVVAPCAGRGLNWQESGETVTTYVSLPAQERGLKRRFRGVRGVPWWSFPGPGRELE